MKYWVFTYVDRRGIRHHLPSVVPLSETMVNSMMLWLVGTMGALIVIAEPCDTGRIACTTI